MNNIIQTIRHTARAATVLLLALLAAQTAGAQTNVSNAPDLAEAFDDTTVSVVNVTDNITGVGILPTLNRALTINLNGNTISGDYLCFIVDPDGSLTINGGGQGGSVGNIISGDAYGPAIDNTGTVTLRNVNITTNFDHAIGGPGMLYIGNNVSFNGWTKRPFITPSVNIIEGGNYNYDPWNYNPSANVVATVTVGGKTHYFENSDAALAYITNNAGKVDFSWSKSDDTYTIHTDTGWDLFCDMLEAGETFSGKTVELANDITVSRMAGGQPFTGTFDGQNHKLTLAYGTADAPVDAQFVAPFVETARDTSPVFRNLTIDGTIYDGYTGSEAHNVGGLIGHLFGTVTIEHCVSRVEIHAKVGAGGFVGLCEHSVSFTDCHSSAVITSADGSNSGFVAWSRDSGWEINFTGCLFDGKLLQQNGTGHSNGGFIGWKGDAKTVNITNCLVTPADLAAGETMATDGSATFSREHSDHPATIKNSYYTQSLGAAQGKQARAVTAGTDVTISAIALTGTATQYTVSGITAYSGGGLQRGETLYYGIDDVVSLTLSNTATGAPDGYQYGYTTNAGTLEGSTLTMPNQDVTVSVNTADLVAIDWSGDGTGSSPFLIEYPSQLDLLAHRVNGTHGETCQANGYYDTYFQLANDISYPHKADGEEGADTESNYEAIGGYYGGYFRDFRGHFDGGGNTISGIRIYKGGSGLANDYQGIFGRTDGADIHNLTLADARITGNSYTGGIVGNNNGTVTRCHVASDVALCAVQSGAFYHGGIVGYNTDGTIELCTSAATLTTADANNSRFYGGIAGWTYGGTLLDNLAIGATVPAAADNTYGAITGHNSYGSLQCNYYAACKVDNTPNATGVGCGCIDNGNGGRIVADVNNEDNPDGARAVFALTLADGITTTTAAIVTHAGTGYYAQGTAIALSYSGTPGNIPDGYQYEDSYGFTASAGTLEGSTLTMPAADVTVSLAIRSTGKLVPVSYLDADGTPGEASAVALDGHEAVDGDGEVHLAAGTYYVGTDIAYTHRIWLNGAVTLILANGKTMTLNGNTEGILTGGYNLTIYGQSLDDDAGTLSYNGTMIGINVPNYEQHSGNVSITTSGSWVYGIIANVTLRGGTLTISANGNDAWAISGTTHSILGGHLTATGAGIRALADGTAITLGWTRLADRITASSISTYGGTVAVADGQTLFDEDGNSYSGNGVTIPAGKTLRPSVIALAANQAPDGNFWTTYYNGTTGFTIDADENACAYTATYGDGQLTLKKLGKEIPAETAVIIVADNDEVSMTATALPAYNDPTNALRGVNVDTPTSDLGDGTFYVLGMTTVNNEQHFGFHRYTGEEMAAHKAFVLVDNSQAPARSLTMVFDDATGIENLTPDAAPKAEAAEHWFTLDGRRLQGQPTAPGIYINNGKKVVIK